jgi:hypothetical protein
MQSVAKGSNQERRVWINWARREGLLRPDDTFLNTRVAQRKSVYRNALEPKHIIFMNGIEQAVINTVHLRSHVIERWPQTIRVLLNDPSDEDHTGPPFNTWYGPPGLQNRINSTHVWTEMIQYFVLEHHVNHVTISNDDVLTLHEDFLLAAGFNTSDDFSDSILDIASMWNICRFDGTSTLKDEVHQFMLECIMQPNPTPRNNPLLFWVAFLLQVEEFNDHRHPDPQRLSDSLTTREKLEALVHYARVLILDAAYVSWAKAASTNKEFSARVGAYLDRGVGKKIWLWIDEGLPRPDNMTGDPDDFKEPHWRSQMAQIEEYRSKYLLKGSDSAVGIILQLL